MFHLFSRVNKLARICTLILIKIKLIFFMSYPLLYKGFFLGIFIFSVILITYDWITIAFFSLCCHYCEEILFSHVLIKTKCHLSPTKSGSNWGIFKIPRVGWASSQATNILKVVQSKTSHFLPIPRKCGTS